MMRLILSLALFTFGAISVGHAKEPARKDARAAVKPGAKVSIPGFGTFLTRGRLTKGDAYEIRRNRLFLGTGKAARPASPGKYALKKGTRAIVVGDGGTILGLKAASRGETAVKASGQKRGHDKPVRKKPGGTLKR
jgi:hypothetical protein